MLNTKIGLPNTCSLCGEKVDVEMGWWAENEDVARSGGGICVRHISKPLSNEPRVIDENAARSVAAPNPNNAEMSVGAPSAKKKKRTS